MATHARDLTQIPLRSDGPGVFSDNMEWLLSNLPGWTTEVNTIADEAEGDAETATEQAGIATAQAVIATGKAEEAAQSAQNAAASATAYLWVSGENVTQWDVVISPANGQSYRRITATGSGSTDPANDATNYEPVSTNGSIVRVARTTNTQLVRANWRDLIDITSGTFSQTFTACSALGNGWWCFIRNSGTGDITLDPNSSETIDGLSSFIMYPGESRLIQCDGSALRSILLAGKLLFVARDEATSGTNAQTLTLSADYQQRTLNTITHNSINGASLASNKITLPAGKYHVLAKVPLTASNSSTSNYNKARLYNLTGASVIAIGTSQRSGAAYNTQRSEINSVFALSSASEIEIQHKILGTDSQVGGVATSIGDTEVYTEIMIERIG